MIILSLSFFIITIIIFFFIITYHYHCPSYYDHVFCSHYHHYRSRYELLSFLPFINFVVVIINYHRCFYHVRLAVTLFPYHFIPIAFVNRIIKLLQELL